MHVGKDLWYYTCNLLAYMKIAFVGKGGSGKTTLCGLFARYLADQKALVLAIDADINQHLGSAACFPAAVLETLPSLGASIPMIKEYVRGDNVRIPSGSVMIKTTPPGEGSRLLMLEEENPLWEHFIREHAGIKFMAVGQIPESDIGTHCYHSKTGAVELLLNHLVDEAHQYVLVDMTAGADSFASGLFTRFDVTCLMVEPTEKSLSVYRQYKRNAAVYHVPIAVIGNKVASTEDEHYIRDAVGADYVGFLSHSSFVRQHEKGTHLPLAQLEPENMQLMHTLRALVDAAQKDWTRFYNTAVLFHKKNAAGWGNAATGLALEEQIDPNFSLEDRIKRLKNKQIINK